MKKLSVVLCFFVAVVLFVQCTKTDLGFNSADFKALPQTVTTPADNPQPAQKIALGKVLFYDPVLSGNRDVACATCHHPAFGFGDGRDLSIGVNGQGLGTGRQFLSPNNIPFAKRNSLSIINTAFNGISTDDSYTPSTAAVFFDNRVRSLEAQSLKPIKTMEEMRGTSINQTNMLDTVVTRLRNNPQYVQLFADAFGATNSVTQENLGKAVAAFERTIIANNSPYDQYVRGNASALNATQV